MKPAVLLVTALVGLAATLVLGRVAPDVVPWVAGVFVVASGAPLVWVLLRSALRGEFGADLLAGVAIVTALLLGEWTAALLVVTMLSGGQLLEERAVARASEALRALAARTPTVAHRLVDGVPRDVGVDDVAVNDELVVLPHETCPVDGVVVEGRARMNEAWLTGEPWEIEKVVGSEVISGAVNGDTPLRIRATRIAADSRYARILEVMRAGEAHRPRIRRIADRLGAWYTPFALAIAAAAWALSGEAVRFLAVLVVATPCPLLIAVPVAVVGSISQAARRGMVIRVPAVLELLDRCRTLVLDKTGTLTAGRPQLVERTEVPGVDPRRLLALVASAEHYSRHPLAVAIQEAAQRDGIELLAVESLTEPPGQGLVANVDGAQVRLTSRRRLLAERPELATELPPTATGLECVVLLDGVYAATWRFADPPRPDGRPFIAHLGPRHGFDRVLILSGDREAEVRAVADALGISEVRGSMEPAEKLAVVQQLAAQGPTLYVGDGINDAPSLAAATVGVAFGRSAEAAAEAAHAVVLEPTLERLDEFLHIGARFRRIALQSAAGGMALSVVGMGFAAAGLLPPAAGALVQEAIDLFALAMGWGGGAPPRRRTDM